MEQLIEKDKDKIFMLPNGSATYYGPRENPLDMDFIIRVAASVNYNQIPQSGRFMLLTPIQLTNLFNSLTDAEKAVAVNNKLNRICGVEVKLIWRE